LTQQNELARLRALKSTGWIGAEETKRLAELEAAGAPVAAPQAAPAAGLPFTPVTAAAGAVDEYTVDLSTEAFARGGQQAIPPSAPGIYPAVCTGAVKPTGQNVQDQLWFGFKSADGATVRHQGVLVTGSLNAAPDKSGAWKVKDVLEALGAKYEVVPGRGVRFSGIVGRPCQVRWDWVVNANTQQRDLRIQDVYAASNVISQGA